MERGEGQHMAPETVVCAVPVCPEQLQRCSVQCCSAWCVVHGAWCAVAGVRCEVHGTWCAVCVPGSGGKSQGADGAAGPLFTCL